MIDFASFPDEALAYFEAAQGRVPWEVVFTPQATVRDVERDIRGRDAIVAWAHNEVDGGVYQILSYQPKEGGCWILVEFHPVGWHGFLAEYEFEFQKGQISRAVLKYSPEVDAPWRQVPLPVRRLFEQGALGPAPTRVVPRIGGLRLEWERSAGPQVREFRVDGDRYGELKPSTYQPGIIPSSSHRSRQS